MALVAPAAPAIFDCDAEKGAPLADSDDVVELRLMRVEGDGKTKLALCYYSERAGAARRLGAAEARQVRADLRAAYAERWPHHVLDGDYAPPAPAPKKRARD